MKIYKPKYFDDFKCIAHRCRHNCCIGWEIDIDDKNYEEYMSVGGELGERLKKNISCDSEPHFILSENDRCPFLNNDNLCDIILGLGEDSLCQICTDHPRFRSFYDTRVEIGLGLCCEAAGRLILSQNDKFTLISAETLSKDYGAEEQNDFFAFRERLFDIMQDREFSILERIDNMLIICGSEFKFSLDGWIDKYLSLERLDEEWTSVLNRLKNNERYSVLSEYDTAFEQLMIYFLYRHLGEGIYDGRLLERVLFCVISFYMVYSICSMYEFLKLEDIAETARMYSSEIEYSEENIEALLNLLV